MSANDSPVMTVVLREVISRLDQLRDALTALGQEVAQLRQEMAESRPTRKPEQRLLPFRPPEPDEQLVTLDQIAAMVRRRKSCLREYRDQMPAPRISGRRGQASLWAWADVRPWLERTFGRSLPESFPGLSA